MKTLASVQNRLEKVRAAINHLEREERLLLDEMERHSQTGDPPFVFLYETGNDQQCHFRAFKSRTLAGAATKMAKFMDRHMDVWESPTVDYEAAFKGKHLDLYALGDRNPIHKYLA